MSLQPKVSVVIPAFNQVLFIEEAVRSVLAQEATDVQIIVADDGSDDGTADVVRRLAAAHPGLVFPIISHRNEGIGANVNRGLARSSGTYVALLAGDDLMLPGKIAAQVDFMEEHTECVLCTHDVDVFESSSGAALYRFSDRYDMHGGGAELMFSTNWLLGRLTQFIPSAHMYRRSAIPPHGFDERLRYANDWLFDIEVLRHGSLGFLPRVLGRYRRHGGNVTASTGIRARSLEETLIVLAIVKSRYPELSELARRKGRFALFQALVFGTLPGDRVRDYQRMFRRECGLVAWGYMRVVCRVLQNDRLFRIARPARKSLLRARSQWAAVKARPGA